MEMITRDQVISKLLADEYGGKILSATFSTALPVQEISKACDIPIAVAYRRVLMMEEVGLLNAVFVDEKKRGRKVKFYKCNVSTIRFTFNEGKFSIEVDWLLSGTPPEMSIP